MVVIINDGCISCGLCCDLCPDEFEFGPEGTAVPIHDPVPEDLEACSEEAAESCPVSVIEIQLES